MSHRGPAAQSVVGEGGGEVAVVGDGGQTIQRIIGVSGKAGRIDHGGAVAVEIVGIDGIEVVSHRQEAIDRELHSPRCDPNRPMGETYFLWKIVKKVGADPDPDSLSSPF